MIAPLQRLDARTLRHETALSFAGAVEALRRDAVFRSALTEAIATCPFEAVFWETPPTARERTGEAFEFVLVDSPTLARVRPRPGAFAGRLGSPVNTFPNLGGDAWLVAPEDTGDFAHLARFLRSAPPSLVDAFWVATGEAMARWWQERTEPVWLSTSGLGVYWLHVRLDRRPKYYTHGPYRSRRV